MAIPIPTCFNIGISFLARGELHIVSQDEGIGEIRYSYDTGARLCQ